jgi:CheY-like chemotaxis protein
MGARAHCPGAREGRPENAFAFAIVATILVVEDHEDSRLVLKLWLEIVGHNVETAPDGPSALAVAEARPPSVAIIDISLPGLTGWDVAQRLRATYGRRIGLIALTSLQSPADRARSAQAGFDVHLVKPATGADLFRAIASLAAA